MVFQALELGRHGARKEVHEHVDLAAGTVLNLDAALAATMGGIRYDGERILGIVSAETYPSFVVGEGFVRTFGRFHITIQ